MKEIEAKECYKAIGVLLAHIDSLEGKVTSGFINPELNNQVLYPNYESQYFDKLPSVKNHQGAFSRLLKFTDLT